MEYSVCYRCETKFQVSTPGVRAEESLCSVDGCGRRRWRSEHAGKLRVGVFPGDRHALWSRQKRLIGGRDEVRK